MMRVTFDNGVNVFFSVIIFRYAILFATKTITPFFRRPLFSALADEERQAFDRLYGWAGRAGG